MEPLANLSHPLAQHGHCDVRPGVRLAWNVGAVPATDSAAAFVLYQVDAGPGRIVVLRQRPADPSSAATFQAMLAISRAALDELLVGLPLLHAKWNAAESAPIFEHPLTPRARLSLDSLRRCPFSGVCRAMALSARGHDLLVEVLTLWSESAAALPHAIGPADRVRAAAEILAHQFEHPPSLGQLAGTVGLSESTLKRGFNQVFGTTVFGYIRARRMEHARQLLESGRATVLEAATLVGYANPSNFATAFRRQFGENPKSFQLRARQTG